MKIQCGNCGKAIIVPDDLVAGQHVRCPYCNEKSAFDKPTRIELPDGFEVKRKARAKIDELKRAVAANQQPEPVRELLPDEQKPKLSIRRPVQESKDREHMNAAAEAVRDRVRRTYRKRRNIRIRKLVSNWLSIVVLVAVVCVGYTIWRAMQTKKLPSYLPEQVSHVISNAVEKVNAEVMK